MLVSSVRGAPLAVMCCKAWLTLAGEAAPPQLSSTTLLSAAQPLLSLCSACLMQWVICSGFMRLPKEAV